MIVLAFSPVSNRRGETMDQPDAQPADLHIRKRTGHATLRRVRRVEQDPVVDDLESRRFRAMGQPHRRARSLAVQDEVGENLGRPPWRKAYHGRFETLRPASSAILPPRPRNRVWRERFATPYLKRRHSWVRPTARPEPTHSPDRCRRLRRARSCAEPFRHSLPGCR